MEDKVHELRVLIADQRADSLDGIAALVEGLGHEVVAREVDISAVGPATARSKPDVALVELGASSGHALDLIRRIVREAACPVIALLPGEDPAFVREAARLGVFGYIVRTSSDELQSAIDLTLQRFAEFSELRGALGRRAVIEQAKGNPHGATWRQCGRRVRAPARPLPAERPEGGGPGGGDRRQQRAPDRSGARYELIRQMLAPRRHSANLCKARSKTSVLPIRNA